MGVKEYIPKKKEIIDRRTEDGGYYIAECDVCGGEFYPTRSNAKYCSKSCYLIEWRRKRKEGDIKPKQKTVKLVAEDGGEVGKKGVLVCIIVRAVDRHIW